MQCSAYTLILAKTLIVLILLAFQINRALDFYNYIWKTTAENSCIHHNNIKSSKSVEETPALTQNNSILYTHVPLKSNHRLLLILDFKK